MRVALLALGVLLAGCTSAPAPVAEPGQPSPTSAAPPAVPPADASAGNGTFPPWEGDLSVMLYAVAEAAEVRVDSGNMQDTMAEVPVPAGARFVTAFAEWTPSTPLSETLDLMVHNGTLAATGETLGSSLGGSPLATEPIALPEGATTVVLMLHVAGDPIGAEVAQDAHVRVEFG